MKKRFETSQEAVTYLSKQNGVNVGNAVIKITQFPGNRTWGAIDYLVNFHHFILVNELYSGK